jgi:hypothetical protein
MTRILAVAALAVALQPAPAVTWSPWPQQQRTPDGRVQWQDGERIVTAAARLEGKVWHVAVSAVEDLGASDAGARIGPGRIELPGLPALEFTHEADRLQCVVTAPAGSHFYGLGQSRERLEVRGAAFAVTGGRWISLPGDKPAAVPLPFIGCSPGYGLAFELQPAFGATVSPDASAVSMVCAHLHLEFRIWAGASPAEIAAVDWQPVAPPPDWALEPWVSVPANADQAKVLQLAARWTAQELPTGVLVIPCAPDATPFAAPAFTDPRAMVEQLHAAGWHVVVDRPWRWLPHLAGEGASFRYLVPEDLSETDAVARLGRSQAALAELGVDGVLHRLDTAAPQTLPEALKGTWLMPTLLQGRVPLNLWQEAPQASAVPSVAFAGSGAVAPRELLVCTTPAPATWPDLAGSLRAVLSLGHSGAPFVIRPPAAGKPGDEAACTRSAQLSALLPVSWTDAGVGAPWEVSAAAVDSLSKAIALRAGFLPLLQSLLREAAQTGAPVARPVSWVAFDDPSSWQADAEFLLGNDLLVAPICSPNGQQTVHLPPGEWMDLYDGSTYQGPTQVSAAATLSQLPLFLRGGAIVPQVLDEALYLPSGASDSRRRVLEVLPPFTRGESSFTWRRDEGDVSIRCRRRGKEVSVRAPGKSLPPRTLLRLEVGPPAGVTVDGKDLPELTEEEVGEGDKRGYAYRQDEQVCFIWAGRDWSEVKLTEKASQARFEAWSFPERPRASAGPIDIQVTLPRSQAGTAPVLTYTLQGSAGLVLGEALSGQRWRFRIPLPKLAAAEDMVWQVMLQLEEGWSIQSRERLTRVEP